MFIKTVKIKYDKTFFFISNERTKSLGLRRDFTKIYFDCSWNEPLTILIKF